ncbi:DEAD/DEAH box helicase [Demequina sp. NBRC 110054]|uniref:DEAD/DEAH box helicase n=1 Tax=Demequina sp. NBRC 110054 TaxID=1570343 RepID=UPI000A013EB1|nr:DEAD/DEAH box helicase [Demequina sp. NBRC 110054]
MPTDSGSAPDAPDTISFADLGLEGPVLEAVRELGYETPSPIQARTIPTLLEGRDVVGLAQTGTGKTAAFALPILARLDRDQRRPQALVLAPTRELALQVCEAFESYASKSEGVRLLPVYGGQAYGVQLSALRRGVHIVVGTPGRIMDHLDRGTLDLSELKYVVLDEADEMLRMGFAEDVETILSATPEDKQVALFSATMPNQIRRLSQKYLRDPEEVTVKGKTSTSSTITQRYIVVSYAQKTDALSRILEVENFEAVIVFTRTKNETEQVAEKLRARGFAAAAINGDVVQQQRERLVQQLKDGNLDVLVATDVAARGLDVERITHVINYDIPVDTESYVHRVGRTGRAGRTGDAISFVTPRERRLLGAIEKATRQPLTPMQLPSVGDVNATRLTRFDDSITAALSETERIDRFRDIIAHYVEHHDVPETDVAAALAVVAQGDKPLLLGDEDELPTQSFSERGKQSRDREGGPGAPGRRDNSGRITYRIEVGRRHKVEPRQIVGAIANEGGLDRGDFGAIKVNSTFSLVELPENLPRHILDKLSHTRISGQLIELKPDKGTRAYQAQKKKFHDRNSRGSKDHRPSQARHDGKPRKPRRGDY